MAPPTEFPVNFDTLGALGTIGGPFIDDQPPVDPFVNIAADFRSNLNDAMLAVQHRVGLTNDINPSSLSWATISVGGVNNLGLRFAQNQSEWPGVVAESGIFLKDGTLEPMFHREGEPKGTFYSMLGGGGGGGTLQDAYNSGNTIVTFGGNSLSISGTENFLFENDATSKFIIGTGAILYTDSNALFHVSQNIGTDNTKAVQGSVTNLVGNNGREFGAFVADVQDFSNMENGEIIYGYACDINMQGDGVGSIPLPVGAAFYARNAIFGGVPYWLSVGMYVDQSYDYAFIAETGNALLTHGAANEIFYIQLDPSVINAGGTNSQMLRVDMYTKSIAARGITVSGSLGTTVGGGVGDGGINFESIYTGTATPSALLAGAEYFLYKAFATTHVNESATAWQHGLHAMFNIPNSGGSSIADVGCSINGVYIDLPESYDSVGGDYHNNDGFFSFARWALYVEQGESHLRRTEFTGASNLGKALVRIDQKDSIKPFYEIQGDHHPDPVTPSGNLCTSNLGVAVVGPLDGNWSFLGMYQVYVIDNKNFIPPGHYWVPLYRAV